MSKNENEWEDDFAEMVRLQDIEKRIHQIKNSDTGNDYNLEKEKTDYLLNLRKERQAILDWSNRKRKTSTTGNERILEEFPTNIKSKRGRTFREAHIELVKKALLKLRSQKNREPSAHEVWSELIRAFDEEELKTIGEEQEYKGLIDDYNKESKVIIFRHPKTGKPCKPTIWRTFENWVSKIRGKHPYHID